MWIESQLVIGCVCESWHIQNINKNPWVDNFLIFIIIVEDDDIDYRGSITRSGFPRWRPGLPTLLRVDNLMG